MIQLKNQQPGGLGGQLHGATNNGLGKHLFNPHSNFDARTGLPVGKFQPNTGIGDKLAAQEIANDPHWGRNAVYGLGSVFGLNPADQQALAFAAGALPIVGEVFDAEDFGRAAWNGDLLGMALAGGALAVPGASAGAIKMLRKKSASYLPPSPPVIKDRKTGKMVGPAPGNWDEIDPPEGTFFGKAYSREEKWLLEEIRKAQAKIDRGEYKPFFDVSKRKDAKGGYHESRPRTLEENAPKTKASKKKYKELTSNPALRETPDQILRNRQGASRRARLVPHGPAGGRVHRGIW